MGDETPIKDNHILMRRLFDSTSKDLEGEFRFDNEELAHLTDCEECRHIRDVFARQFVAMKAKSAGSNDVA